MIVDRSLLEYENRSIVSISIFVKRMNMNTTYVIHAKKVISKAFNDFRSFSGLSRIFVDTNENGLFSFNANDTTASLLIFMNITMMSMPVL